jgi:hypothetical protein
MFVVPLQAWPHVPQLLVLLSVSTHALLHAVIDPQLMHRLFEQMELLPQLA